MEMVSSGEINHVHISFMVAGHTKFAPDRLFSVIGSAYKRDVFTIHELKAICDQSATTLKTDSKFSPGEIVLEINTQTFLACANSTTFLW